MENYAVIFDMDGVICHTNPYHVIAFKAFFEKHEIPYTEKEFEDHIYGKHNSHILSYFFKRTIQGKELIELENEKEELFREIYKTKVESINGFENFLTSLKQNNFKTAVATSAPRANMNLIVDKLNIRSKINSLMASENVTLHKPHPDVYLKSAANVNVSPENALVFEDSYSGITAGINAGMKVVAVLSSHTKEQLPPCSYYIHDYTEISVEKVLELLRSK